MTPTLEAAVRALLADPDQTGSIAFTMLAELRAALAAHDAQAQPGGTFEEMARNYWHADSEPDDIATLAALLASVDRKARLEQIDDASLADMCKSVQDEGFRQGRLAQQREDVKTCRAMAAAEKRRATGVNNTHANSRASASNACADAILAKTETT